MELKSEIEFIDAKLSESFNELPKIDVELYKFIKRALEEIRRDAFCGTQIRKSLMPKEYRKYRLENLWKYNLPRGWRLLYTIEHDNIVIVAVILDWMTHKEYERKFNY